MASGVKKLKRAQLLAAGAGLKNGRFAIRRVIAEGGFGQIYEAADSEEQRLVAVKAEEVGCPLPLLRVELLVYRSIDETPADSPLRAHFVRNLGYGESNGANFLVLDLVGHNLMELKKSLRTEQMSAGTSLRLGTQILRGLRNLHSLGWLHRDVKPSNFCVGRGEAGRTVFVLDFGLARIYRHSDGEHKEARSHCGFRGTVRYASTNIHAGMDMGRRDDLHSLYYIMAEQLLAQLPWRRMTDKKAVWETKTAWVPPADALPPSVLALGEAARHLAFHDEPDYDALAAAFALDLDSLGVDDDDPLDWESAPRPLPIDPTPDSTYNPLPLS